MSTFTGDMLATAPDRPLELHVTIDNQDAKDCPDNPFTLNAYVIESGERIDLVFRGEGALIEGDVPTQLRMLAKLIETGEVTR